MDKELQKNTIVKRHNSSEVNSLRLHSAHIFGLIRSRKIIKFCEGFKDAAFGKKASINSKQNKLSKTIYRSNLLALGHMGSNTVGIKRAFDQAARKGYSKGILWGDRMRRVTSFFLD